ncbi:hypothetical protein CMV_009340 [Castanea mollissima]|uniref:Uncharacterized protein n=1 Tax=Castanea mollissima TaxID=60419 RepID=A0A8J4R7B7_9ROSI|nr:hypothetical protein CMV_009340 [Castanea mollissima]
MKAIETSRMAVVVFSKSYATSDRCLDELAKIMECNRVLNQRVFPIFYDVSPSQVREQKGNFEEAANLAGFHLKANRPESEFIEEIVENILKKLNEESSTAPSLRQNDAPVPTGTKSRSVVCEIKKNHLKVGLKGQPPIIDGELFRPVKPDDCYWSIEDQSAISILLTKRDKMERWKSIVKGDPEIDTQKVEPESIKLSDPDPETRQTVEKMMDNSGLYKNLLQELVKKEGGEFFKGHEARTKKQAEMNAAKIAYTSLKDHASSGLDLENYSWTQTLEEVTLNVPVPTGSRSVVCEIKKNHLKVGLKGQPPIIDGELFRPVKPDDCYWRIEDQSAISILLTKHDKMEWWKSIVIGDPEINTQKVEPESSKLSDPDPETRQTVEKMMDNSGLYKNLLRELVQKEGFSLPAYDTNRSGEEHEAIFVSTVEIRKVFKGHEARTKRQAEMNAAKIAYTSLKEHMQHFYKNQLQNYAQKRNLCQPVYSCEPEGPPHASHFRCKVTVDGQTYESPEFFSTLKDAERAAAKVALTSLVPNGAKEDNSGLYKNLLQELVKKEGYSLPVYDTNRSGEVHVPIFVSTVEIEGEVFKGHEARTKRQAEMNAAKIAYTSLKEHMQHFYKNQLQNYAQKRNLCLPVYSCEPEGPPHASHFRCKVTVDGQTYESPEFFSTSKDAERAAAKVALTSLVPDGAKEDNSGLYKNLLQELVKKEGYSLPVYDTNRSGEVHVPIFVSTVEIEGEFFKGHEARTKKQAEMNAAKIAYTSLKDRKFSFLSTLLVSGLVLTLSKPFSSNASV